MKKILFSLIAFLILQSCGGESIGLPNSDIPPIIDENLPVDIDDLYSLNCETCHNPLISATKKESSAESIQEAIGYIPAMNHLSSLTNEQIESIAESLSFSSPTLFDTQPIENSEFESEIDVVNISFNTNEVASCRYSLTDEDYASMTSLFTESESVSHSVDLSVTEGTEYLIYIRCADVYGNVNDISSELPFRVKGENELDTKPPEIIDYSPAYGEAFLAGTTERILSLTTDESAVCRYTIDENEAYESMTVMSSTNGVAHSQNTTNLEDGETYYYYFVCADAAANESLKLLLSFTVDAEALNGVELYNRNCLQCHGDIDNSEVLYRTAEQIESAIESVNVMQTENLESLIADQIQLIADALIPEVVEVNENELNTNLILADRRYLDHVIMHKVFGKADNEDSERNAYFERDSYMLYRNFDHGGACDRYTEARFEEYGDSRFPWERCVSLYAGAKFANTLVSYTTIRAAYIIRACETNAADLNNIAAATEIIGGSDTDWSTENFTAMYQKFFLFETPDPIVVEKFKDVFDAPSSNQLGWQGVLLGLCISPDWQVLYVCVHFSSQCNSTSSAFCYCS